MASGSVRSSGTKGRLHLILISPGQAVAYVGGPVDRSKETPDATGLVLWLNASNRRRVETGNSLTLVRDRDLLLTLGQHPIQPFAYVGEN